MKIKSRFLFIGLLLLFNPSISNVKASIPDAKYSDYLILGKVRRHKEVTASKDGYSCPPGNNPQTSFICSAGKGKDKLGKSMLSGWIFFDPPGLNWVTYVDPELYKVKFKNEYGRYINLVEVTHSYQEPTAGSSGYSYSTGSAKTRCNDFRTINGSYDLNLSMSNSYSGSGTSSSSIGGAISCETKPAEIINVPGTGSTEGYVNVSRLDWIIDCKEKRVAAFRNMNEYRLFEKWHPINESKNIWIDSFASKFCPVIPALKPSLFTKLSNANIE